MPRINQLSALKVDRLREPGMYFDGVGLYLQVTIGAGGSINKSWIFRFEVAGRGRQMGLGSFPDTALADARRKAADARRLREEGKDPIAEKRAQRAAQALQAAKQVTFRQAAADYIRQHESGWRNQRHHDQWENTLEQYAFPVLGDIPVAKIDTDLVLRVLRPLWKDKPVTGARLRGRVESIVNFAVHDGDRANPARWKGHLEHKLDKRLHKIRGVKHLAALPYEDVPVFMTELRKDQGVAAMALQFVILTAARSGEVLGARWDEVDLAERSWTVPATRMKGNRPHRVPLTDAATAILTAQAEVRQNDFVFPGDSRAQLSTRALLDLVKRPDHQVTVHGFRASFKTWATEQTGFPREVIEAALAHAIGDAVEAAYQRGDLMAKRRALMDAWAAYCDRAPGAEVVPLRGKVAREAAKA